MFSQQNSSARLAVIKILLTLAVTMLYELANVAVGRMACRFL